MLPLELKAFAPFRDFSAADLAAAAAASRRIRLPARRWLVRPGRVLGDHFFLLEGRVLLVAGGRASVVTAGSERARRAVYPGAAGVETLTEAVFADVPAAALERPGGSCPEAAGLPAPPQVSAAEGSWEQSFLTSPLMARLPPAAWQRVLRAMTRHTFAAGEIIIQAGDPGDCCYVLTAGRAQIRHPAGHVIAGVAPGRLFGEDALVTGAARNASVVMTAAGGAVSLPGEEFQRRLLDAVVRPTRRPGDRCLLSLDGASGGAACPQALPLVLDEVRAAAVSLCRRQRYAVVGGQRGERLLAAFLLAEQGLDARPVVADAGPC
ncbi:MAG: cyclic nucleotide-binding domain-containing protein [Gammaproteobacteria bacterium]|nr:cyclic nucleotide-binding domain-containing protein [Gammaproteobacteria bacterium]